MLEPIIKVKDLSIIYNQGKENEFKASAGVNMEIYPGEYIIFFGPSGCGKSTVLYSVLGVLAPTSGEVLVRGENIYTYSPNEMVKYQTSVVGIMYQAFFLIPSLSVGDNVSLPLIFKGIAPSERKKMTKILLDRFGIGKQANKFPDALSGGQQQRVSVARAFVNDPQIILADEPVGNLDSISADAVMETLAGINKKDKKTIILVTHDAKYLPYAHRVIYMRDGRVVRIVANPEKKQIARVDRQKTLVTEMEQLAKIHPYLQPIELKVKSIVNYLTQDLSFEQLSRLENNVKIMLEGKMSEEEFKENLVKKYKDGGAEIGASLSGLMAEKITTILGQANDIRRYRRRMDQNIFFSRENKLIVNITKYLAQEHNREISPPNLKKIKELVYKRVAGLIKKDEFENLIQLPPDKGGAEFNKQEARKTTLYFEKLLIQGLDMGDGGH